MRYTLEIHAEGAAFESDPQHEVARIMRDTANRLEAGENPTTVRDFNGNTVGRLTVYPGLAREHARGRYSKGAEELRDALRQFIGTTQYHRLTHVPGLLATDGIAYLAEEAGAFWLVDAVASYQLEPEVRALGGLQVWRLRVTEGAGGVRRAMLEAGDDINEAGRMTVRGRPDLRAVRQAIPFTDFPLDEIKLYVGQAGDGKAVLMLPSER